MKIYLRNLETKEWELKIGTLKELKKDLDARNIIIAETANIGDYANIGNYAIIGYSAKIGNYAIIGYNANIGNCAIIGEEANIGDSANIGYKAKIGYSAKIGDRANIGDSANIGDNAKIGYKANIVKFDIFSETAIFINLGIVMNKGKGIFYKAVKTDLTDFHTSKYQYKIGKGDKCDLERNQDIECGQGWHFTSLWKAIEYGKQQSSPFKVISAEVELKDILSIHQKVRVKAYKNVQKIDVSKLI